MNDNFFDRTERRVGIFFWAVIIFNILWMAACATGLFFLGKAAIEWLNRN